jgi:hypothetical protein
MRETVLTLELEDCMGFISCNQILGQAPKVTPCEVGGSREAAGVVRHDCVSCDPPARAKLEPPPCLAPTPAPSGLGRYCAGVYKNKNQNPRETMRETVFEVWSEWHSLQEMQA